MHQVFAALVAGVALVQVAACTSSNNAGQAASNAPQFSFRQNLPFDSFGIIGIAAGADETLWLSDADGNQLLHVDSQGQVLDKVAGFDRPMHIATSGGGVIAAEYSADVITGVSGTQRSEVVAPDSLDAPSGVDVLGNRLAVADFYKHRVGYLVDGEDRSFGTKGTGAGEFTYPTDVQFAHDIIWVADAYNHRVQVFDLNGAHLLTFGEAEGLNAATGLYVGEEEVFVTDFENSRLLVYSLTGQLQEIITEQLDKPTDALLVGDTLYVVNYAGRFLSTFAKTR